MNEGIYEDVQTERLRERLESLEGLAAETALVDEADHAHVLTQFLSGQIRAALESTRGTDAKLALTNSLLATLANEADSVVNPLSQLLRLDRASDLAAPRYPRVRPSAPLSDAYLLTNARDEPQLAHELRAELDTADGVDLLCAFIQWRGIRVLEAELARLRERGAPLRVITTTYVGATERLAIDRLVRDFGAEVKVQYDILRTRLHAKAWMFGRGSGLNTAYVGSSNLSRSALVDGLEWNVRLSAMSTPLLLDKFRATFDSYWDDPTFETYDPDRDGDKLDDALAEASGRVHRDRATVSLSGLQVRPYPHQSEMLDALVAEREMHDRHRNLLVAATGTGKTVVAALDFKQIVGSRNPSDVSLLFVAHRKEILEQARRTYREVLNIADFGEVFVGGARPERWRHVFASVQSLNSYGVDRIPSDAFDVVVIDEFHHAEAPTYRRLFDRLRPEELLGLTATPERTDGVDVTSMFGGRIAFELRLWDALSADLLCPFHYFGIGDNTDLSTVEWRRGRYDEGQLSDLYTGNSARSALILKALIDKVGDVGQMRALGFCVSVAHAEYMARTFNEAGIRAAAVVGATPAAERASALDSLRAGTTKILFVVDVFNEGLDVPAVNTVLFLRPTESATVFLQQLGRGLRHAPGKALLTVLDFVGNARADFRFDRRFRALTGLTRRGVERAIEKGFPFLPAGSQIVLDELSRERVLANIRTQLRLTQKDVAAELKVSPTKDLGPFLSEAGLEVSDVLKAPRSWSGIKRLAGISQTRPGPMEEKLMRRVRALAHVDDKLRADIYLRLLATPEAYETLSPQDRIIANMLFFSIWPSGGGFRSYQEGFDSLRDEPAFRTDVSDFVRLSLDATRQTTQSVTLEGRTLPLKVHARYQREEILAALAVVDINGRKPDSYREGVVWAPAWNADVLLITLRKSLAEYSPSTMYRDYALSRDLFHWESQSTTALCSAQGVRYVTQRARGGNVLLFVREAKTNDLGTDPYLFLGPADYVSHTGERPIQITWSLRHPMPVETYLAASAVAQ